MSFLAGVEEAVSLALGRACGENTIGLAEHVFHSVGLLGEVPIGALDDTDGVNPEILDPKLPGDGDCILECCWQVTELDVEFECLDIIHEGAEMWRPSPRMRERQVPHVVARLCFVQLYRQLSTGSNINKPAWHGEMTGCFAIGVLFIAFGEPMSKALQVDLTTSFRKLSKAHLQMRDWRPAIRSFQCWRLVRRMSRMRSRYSR